MTLQSSFSRMEDGSVGIVVVALCLGMVLGVVGCDSAGGNGPESRSIVHTATLTPSSTDFDAFGAEVTGVGDVNGDGTADFAIAEPGEPVDGVDGRGQVYVHDGTSGEKLHTLDSPVQKPDLGFGQSLAAIGDVSGDSVEDIAVGPSNDKFWEAFVFSGNSGDLLYTLSPPNSEQNDEVVEFGHALVGVQDVDGDDVGDIAVGAPKKNTGDGIYEESGKVYVFSGDDGQYLGGLTMPNQEAYADFGRSLAGGGDTNGDGFGDIVVGAPRRDQVYVFQNGTSDDQVRIYQSPADRADLRFGYVEETNDLSGDGSPDLVVGAPVGVSTDIEDRAYLYNGGNGSQLGTLQVPGSAGQTVSGENPSALGDVDGDGVNDVLLGNWYEVVDGTGGAGQAYLFSGSDGSLVDTLQSPNVVEDGSYGRGLASVGEVDVSEDGATDFVVGAPTELLGDDTPEDRGGRVYLYEVRTVN